MLAIASFLLSLGTLPVSPATQPASDPPSVVVRVDSAPRQVTITAVSLRVPSGATYSGRAAQGGVYFTWPVSGWARGYHMELTDSLGHVLPRSFLHHAAVANLGRRQMLDPTAERIFAVGSETDAVRLPSSLGLPVSEGQRMLLYYALVNPSGPEIQGARIRLVVEWVPSDAKRPRDVLPLVIDANPLNDQLTRTFEVPPGVSIRSAEFTLPVGGHLRAMGAHLHDYGVEIRLEDVQSGKVLARLRGQRRADGTLSGVDQTRFLTKRGGLRLEAGRRYRAIAIYDNPTCEPGPDAAMAFLVGAFLPDDLSRWPAMDRTHPLVARDIVGVTTGEHGGSHHHHGGEAPRASAQRSCSPAAGR